MSKVRTRRLALLAIAAASTSIPALSLAPGTASAFCNGTGNPYSWWAGSTINGDEAPASGTCDGLLDYNGLYRALRPVPWVSS